VQGAAQLTTGQVKQIGAAFLATAGHSTFSAQQMSQAFGPVAGVVQQLSGGTLSATSSMQFMRAAMDASEATGNALGTTTTDLASVMQAFGLNTGQAGEAANQLFNISRQTGVGLDSLAAVVGRLHGRLGPVAPDLAQTGALMVDLAQHGISGSRGVMVVQTALTTLLGGTKPVNAELKKLGVHVFDSSGKFVGMQSVLGQLTPKLKGMTDQQRLAAEALIFGKTASIAMNATVMGGVGAYNKALAATVAKNAVDRAAAEQAKTLHGQLETVVSATEDMAVKTGQFLIPVLTHLMGVVSAVAGWLDKHRVAAIALGAVIAGVLVAAIAIWVTNLVIAAAASVTAFATDLAAGATWVAEKGVQYALAGADAVAGAATATLAWVTSSAQTLLSGAATVAGWAIQTATMAAAAVASAVASAAAWVIANAAMIAGIALVVVAVVAAVALIIKYHKDIEKAVVAVWHAIEAAAKAVWQAIQTVVHTVIAIITGYITVEEKAWEAVFHAVEAVVKTVWNNVEGATKTVISDITGFFAKLPGQILGFLTGLPGDFLKLGESVVSAFLNAFKDIGGKVGGMLKGALGHIPGVGGLMSHIPGLAEGGLVTRPTLALVGESGPEMVVPLSKFATAGTHGVQALPSGGGVSSQTGMAGGTVINVIMNVGGSVLTEGELVRTIQQGLLKLQQRTGNLGFTAA
jgi:TP901 family phage tail tape measure protein